MHIHVDITHPAHVHFYKYAIDVWKNRGDRVSVTARGKDVALQLLDNLGIEYTNLGKASKSMKNLLLELPLRDWKLYQAIRRLRPDVVTAEGGIFAAHAALMAGIPSVIFYDTESAVFQNLLTYPFASKVCVPDCYRGWTPQGKSIHYPGYHELAYTHPDIFTPDPTVLNDFGLEEGDDYIVLRLVSWTASHDLGKSGINDAANLVEHLEKHVKVIVSSENPVPEILKGKCIIHKPECIHHLMYYAKLLIGESATMATESALLGTPSIFISTDFRGYTDELQDKYGLVHICSDPVSRQQDAIEKAIRLLMDPEAQARHQKGLEKVLSDKMYVTPFIVDQVDSVLTGCR